MHKNKIKTEQKYFLWYDLIKRSCFSFENYEEKEEELGEKVFSQGRWKRREKQKAKLTSSFPAMQSKHFS